MQALAQTGALGAHLKMYGSRYDLALKAMHEVGKNLWFNSIFNVVPYGVWFVHARVK